MRLLPNAGRLGAVEFEGVLDGGRVPPPLAGQRSGREDEPHRQGRHHQALPLPGLEALKAYVLASGFAKHLKALRWRTPFQAICDAWAKDPATFKIDPRRLMPGPNT